MHIAYLIVEIYLYVVIARVIVSWFPIGPDSPFRPVVRALGAVTDPILTPLRRVLPPLRIGGMGIDLSPIILLVALEIVLQILA